MKLIAVLLILQVIERAVYPLVPDAQTWVMSIGIARLSQAIAVQYLLNVSKTASIITRSIIALVCCFAWLDLASYIAWAGFDIDASPGIFVVLMVWLVWIAKRPYEIKSDPINPDNVMILFLKPRTTCGVIKAFFGIPVASVCLLACGKVWAFSKSSDTYRDRTYTDSWLEDHIAIDTGVKTIDSLMSDLAAMVGTKRGIGIKCLYQIKTILKHLGHEWEPVSIIPGIYALQIILMRSKTSTTGE
jgi:hypothetical protein